MPAAVGIDVRQAVADELDAVAALRLSAYEEHLRLLPDGIAAPYREELRDPRPGPAGSRLIVALDGGALAGSVLFMPDATIDSHPAPAGSSAVRLVAVAPHLRGRGIGELLMRHCIESAEAAGADHVVLHTAPFMRDARRLYTRLGFARAPSYDFDPHSHYAGNEPEPDAPRVQGLAYVLKVRRS